MGKETSNNRAAERISQQQVDMAQGYYDQTAPLRGSLIDDSMQFLNSDLGVNDRFFSSPEYQAQKSIMDAQSQRAIDNAIANTPEGGGLTSQLTDIDMQRALGETQMAGDLASRYYDRALGLGTGGAVMGQQGLGMAGTTAAQMALAESQQNAGKASGLGSAAGMAAGGYFGSK